MVTIDDAMSNNIRSCLHRCGSAQPGPRILVSRSNRGRASSNRRPARQPALCYHGDREQRYWRRGEYCVSLKWTNNLWLVLKQNIWTWICNLRFGPGSDPRSLFCAFLILSLILANFRPSVTFSRLHSTCFSPCVRWGLSEWLYFAL